ncbi:MAG: hypothetical protein KAG66_24000, partial [Methylococcales bacterium]|nr:hypothetical protein [Methylococcales bacterium]
IDSLSFLKVRVDLFAGYLSSILGANNAIAAKTKCPIDLPSYSVAVLLHSRLGGHQLWLATIGLDLFAALTFETHCCFRP